MKRVLGLLLLVAARAQPPQTYELVVASERDGGEMAFYLTDVDTTSWEVIVPSDTGPYGPEWSPDGQTLAYTAEVDSVRTVVFLKDGVYETPVENGAFGASTGGFSPDGTRFLYSRRSERAVSDVMMLDLTTGEATQLTNTGDYNAAPVFTPDGGSMVHCRQHTETRDGEEVRNGDIFRTDLETGEITRLTTAPEFDCLAHVSPAGDEVAYHSCGEGGCRIRVVGIDGTGDRLLLDVEGSWPRWSPDGAWIAFTGTIDGNTDIWIVRPDGTELRAVTTGPGRDEVAAWRPTGD
ncbi:MAG: hypothetical protein HKN29_02375 [Rhodothermales bacterium]|nr:hypothetical protein [Rhodothermales bacterium]